MMYAIKSEEHDLHISKTKLDIPVCIVGDYNTRGYKWGLNTQCLCQ